MRADLFQSKIWEEFKLKSGYSKSYRVQEILILVKKLPLNRTMLYSPMINEVQVERLENKGLRTEFLGEVNKIAKENNSIFYRLELNIDKTNPKAYGLSPKSPFIPSFEEMQPLHNWLVDLTQTEEEILAGMKQKGRYNIKISQKSELTMTSSNVAGKELEAFYESYALTGKRHKITYRGKAYFESLLEILGSNDYCRVYTVWHGKTALASAVITYFDKSALYLYGGSSELHREMNAPYLLHWEIMREAKERGCLEYNFLGVAPDDSPKHSWAGITRFKKQFGGYQVDILGCFDLPLRKLEYAVFKVMEKIRRS